MLILVASAAVLATPAAAQEQATTTASFSVHDEIHRQAKGRVRKFYAQRNFAPLWISSGRIGKEADILLTYLASANLDGLDPHAYEVDKLKALVEAAQSQDAAALARADIALSDAFADYVRDMRKLAKLKKIYPKTKLKHKKLKADALLAAATLSPSLAEYMASMSWMSPHYVDIRAMLGKATSQGASSDVLQRLRLNLDRARVLPGPWTHHVVVDASSGRLWFYQAGKQMGMMRVVVGKPESPTPMLAGKLEYAILNPYWNVPVDLVQKNIAPKILAGQSLHKMGYEALSDWSASAAKLDPETIDWQAVASGRKELRLRQLPGPANFMGKVKFMFPNDLGIYLHDTPERDLLKKANRHFSNGCIRLEDAARLGKWLLGTPMRSPSKEAEQIVMLPAAVPIYLTYLSATETKNGIAFRDDVYGRDLE